MVFSSNASIHLRFWSLIFRRPVVNIRQFRTYPSPFESSPKTNDFLFPAFRWKSWSVTQNCYARPSLVSTWPIITLNFGYCPRSSTRAWSRRTSCPFRDRSSTSPATIPDVRPTAWWHSTSPPTRSVRTARYRRRRPPCLMHRRITIRSCTGTATRISRSATTVSAHYYFFLILH